METQILKLQMSKTFTLADRKLSYTFLHRWHPVARRVFSCLFYLLNTRTKLQHGSQL